MDDRSPHATSGNVGRWLVLVIIGALLGLGVLSQLLSTPSPVDQAQPSPSTQPTAVALATSTKIKPSATATIVLFPSTTPLPTAQAQASTALAFNQLGPLATLDPELIKPAPIKPDALPLAVATRDRFATMTPFPTVTAIPEPALERHIYLINRDTAGSQVYLNRADPNAVVPIAAIDAHRERFVAILPAQQTLLIPRNRQLIAIDLLSKQERWRFPLAPTSSGMLALDQAQTGIYLLEKGEQHGVWHFSYRALADGRALAPTKELQFQPDSTTLVTAAGQLWFVRQRELFRLDLATNIQTSFGMSYNNRLMGNGQQTELAIFRSSDELGLINWATGSERVVRLKQPIKGVIADSVLALDQTMLLVVSDLNEHETDIDQQRNYYSVYRLTDGELQTHYFQNSYPLFYPASTADQWLKAPTTTDLLYYNSLVYRWNSSTNTTAAYVVPIDAHTQQIYWLGEVVGAAVEPLAAEFLATVDPTPTSHDVLEDLATPAPITLPTKPVLLLQEWPEQGPTSIINQVWGDQQLTNLAKIVVALLPRPNQPPLVVSRPEIMTWQLYDPATEQLVEWQFDRMILLDQSGVFNPILSANGEQLMAIVQQDLSSTDEFTATYQLVAVHTKTGAWKVLADSADWPDLAHMRLLAWQGQQIYFHQLKEEQTHQSIWRVELGAAFQPEKIVTLRATLATPFTEWPADAEVVVSPNQRWLLYPFVNDAYGITVQILDLVQQQSHSLQLPLNSRGWAERAWFSPAGDHVALTIRDYATQTDYLALYDFDQQQLYQLDYARHYGFSRPFLWSPDGHWLALVFNDFSPAEDVYIFDVAQAQLAAKTKLDSMWSPIALDNAGQTMLADVYRRGVFEQLQLTAAEWQPTWRIQLTTTARNGIRYVYPR
ncbi:hypothetical protein ACP8Y2_01655 [Herpetosiphon llansteffanensis]